jgi:hypothetical protein
VGGLLFTRKCSKQRPANLNKADSVPIWVTHDTYQQ